MCRFVSPAFGSPGVRLLPEPAARPAAQPAPHLALDAQQQRTMSRQLTVALASCAGRLIWPGIVDRSLALAEEGLRRRR